MDVLVMGGSLFNGRGLVDALVAAGHQVTVSNRGRTKADLPVGVETAAADRTDHDQLRSVLAGRDWDAVVDMSAYHPDDVSVMVDILNGHTGHYVFVSSTVIYATGTPNPIDETAPVDRSDDQNEYGLDKILCEELLFEAHREQGFPATVAALGMVFGPGNAIPNREQRMFTRMVQGRPILVPGDGATRSVVGYIDDQSEALTALLGVEASFGRRFNVTGNDPHSDQRYIDACAAATGATPELIPVPAELMDQLWDGEVSVARDGGDRSALNIRPTDAAMARLIPHAHRFQLASLVQRLQPNLHRWNSDTVFSVDALMEVTGWQPRFSFDDAVNATHEWWAKANLETVHDFAWEDEILAMIRS